MMADENNNQETPVVETAAPEAAAAEQGGQPQREGRGRGRGRGGGGGYATRINAPQDNMVPYANSAQNVNASNPIIRRATIRRERSDSEKGRLKTWQ